MSSKRDQCSSLLVCILAVEVVSEHSKLLAFVVRLILERMSEAVNTFGHQNQL